jgi:hypothetical protein
MLLVQTSLQIDFALFLLPRRNTVIVIKRDNSDSSLVSTKSKEKNGRSRRQLIEKDQKERKVDSRRYYPIISSE